MASGTEYRCATCSKVFGRRAHLNRHSESHNATRPHACPLCHSSFQRLDVLRRHVRSCDAGLGRPTTKRRACDRCVQLKKACSSYYPCDNCTRRNVPCVQSFAVDLESGGLAEEPTVSHSESHDDALHHPPPLSGQGLVGSGGLAGAIFEPRDSYNVNEFEAINTVEYTDNYWRDLFMWDDDHNLPTALDPDQKYQQCFEFLEKFTRCTGFVLSFDCGTYRQRQQVLEQCWVPVEAYGSSSVQSILINNTLGLDALNDIYQPTSSVDPLQWKTHEIILLVKEVVTVKPRNSAVSLSWSSALEAMCFQFFSPPNLRKFLTLFWTIWHPNVNFIHRPTFDPLTCKTTLLLSMVLIGACVSPNGPDLDHAKYWFDCVEEMAFTDVDLSSDFLPPSASQQHQTLNLAGSKDKIQALQAAYNVCLFQNWEGCDTSKWRVRRYRFGTIVSASRDIGISRARHRPYNSIRSSFDRHEWVACEELIRIFLWVFLLDNAFVIFNNLPPRLMIKEATMHFASPEACFQAADETDCFDQIQHWLLNNISGSQLSYLAGIETIRRMIITSETVRLFAFLGPLNLFALISALHALIFQYQHSFGEDAQLIPIQSALKNSWTIWQLYVVEFSASPPHAMVTEETMTVENMGNRVGFCKHASEYWLLAKLMLDRLTTAKPSEPGTASELLGNELACHRKKAAEPILHDYDQTSMQQVNDLITNLQNVNIR